MRLPIATSIESRDGSLTKDAKLVNCFVDVEGETSFVVKRPGLRKSVASAAGAGLGMVSWEGNMYHATGLTFYQTSYASIPGGGGSPPTATVTLKSTLPDWLNYSQSAWISASPTSLLAGISFNNGSVAGMLGSPNGVSWSPASYAANSNLILATQDVPMLYVGGYHYVFSGGVWRSANGGSTWVQIYSGSNIGNGSANAAESTFLHDGTKFVYFNKYGQAGANKGFFTSSDCATWAGAFNFSTTNHTFANMANFVYLSGKYYALNYISSVTNPDGIANGSTVISESANLTTWTHHVIATDSFGTFNQIIASDGTNLVLARIVSNNIKIYTIDKTTFTKSSELSATTGNDIGSIVPDPVIFNGKLIIHARDFSSLDRVYEIVVSGGSSFVTAPYSYAFTTATPGLPLSWVGTSPGAYTKKMFIKNTEKAWTLTLGTPGTLTQVTDADYPAATVPGAVYLDGYFFVMDKDGTIYNCDLENPDSWNALNYITAEAEWDKGVAIAKHQNYVVALKDWTCELFYDAANPTGSPLSKVSNATIQIGCAQGYSAVQFHGGLIFMSKTRERGRSVHFFPSNSIEPQEIASPAIQRILNVADLTTVRAWGGKLGGRILYVLNLVTADISLVYDFTSQTWAQWTSDNAGTEGYFKYGFYATDGNRDYLLHETSGEVFTFTPDVYQDNGADIKVLIRSGRFDAGNMDRKTMSALTVVGDQVSTSLNVQYSDDDYQTFSAARSVSMNDSPARLLRLGMFRRRSFDIRHVDNTPLRLMAIDAEVKQAR